ncbi:restriction endonuclease [Elioraea thermophila]|uniref:restriction endonuclease n=1 Tax=Elioraea thermophila TaxID=2185104 RepID=UPI000DF18145|nr:restriction endonuclease [Elioraea thermophila]
MPIPDYETLMLPVLRSVAAGPKHIRDISREMADLFRLTPEERAQEIPSGKGVRVIHSRTGWAKTYMKQAGLVRQPRRGVVEITDRGRALLAENPERIDTNLLKRFPEFRSFLERSRASAGAEAPSNAHVGAPGAAESPAVTATAEERLDLAAAELDTALRDEILTRLRSSPPRFFERVVLDVLKALGYGAGSGGASQVVGGAGDGGIDGIIEEDRLGLDRIYVQAKRYGDAAVGAPIIQNFIGALQMRGANKGVLITTSTFTRQAEEAARTIPSLRIVLIDGDRLADLMIRHNVGVRTKRTIEIKDVDLDYFEPEDA